MQPFGKSGSAFGKTWNRHYWLEESVSKGDIKGDFGLVDLEE